MRLRSTIAVATALALLAGPVLAAVGEDGTPAEASASSGFTLLDLSLGSTSVQVLDVELGSSTADSPALSVTPLRLNGAALLETAPAPGSAVDVPDTADLLPGTTALASLVVPPLGYTVTGSRASTGTFDLPQVRALGVPLVLDGTLAMSSMAGSGGSEALKQLVIEDLALPSIGDLLAARGVDVSKLPLDVLRRLVTQLDVATPAFTTATQALTTATATIQAQLDAAQLQVDFARAALLDGQADLAAETALLTEAQAQLDAALSDVAQLQAALVTAEAAEDLAQSAVTAATGAVTAATAAVADGLLDGLFGALLDLEEVILDNPDDPLVKTLTNARTLLAEAEQDLLDATDLVADVNDQLDVATDLVTTRTAARDVLSGTVSALQDVVDGLQDQLTLATTALANALTTVPAALLADLASAALGALDAAPLLSLDELELTTRAATSTGSQVAQLVSGRVDGLRVLGVSVIGSLPLTTVTGPAEALVDSAVGTVAERLSDVLSPLGISVPLPSVDLLSPQTSTSDIAGLGSASTSLTALTLRWPALAVPVGLASGSTADLLTLRVASLREDATYRAAVAGTPAAGPVDPGPVGPVPVDPTPVDPDPVPVDPTPVDPDPVDPVPTTGPVEPEPVDPGPVDPGRDEPAPVDPAEPAQPAPGAPAEPDGPVVPPAVVRVPPPAAPPVTAPVQPRTTPVALTQLPRTGADSPTAVLALVLVAGALALHRRRGTA